MKIKVKNKRGIRIQTRYIISGFLLLLQFAFLFFVQYNLSEHYIAIYNICEMIAVITVIYIINRRGNPSYKIMWITFILIFPIFGISVFLLWGGGRVPPHLRNRMNDCEDFYLSKLREEKGIREQLRHQNVTASRHADYLTFESGYPLYRNTAAEYLSPGEKILPRLLEELEKAEKYIYIEFFIIAEGKMWEDIYAILKRKAAEGLEIKILFDDFGSIKRQHKDFITRLKSAGIQVAVFNKLGPSMNIFMNNRNHRKAVIIDGKVAVTGGFNLADEYINEVERFGYWLDCGVILKGEAVKSFVAMFCGMWKFTTKQEIDLESHLPKTIEVYNNGYVLPYCDDPLSDKNPAEGIYMQILNTAQRYVYITSPYLIIDNTMISTLKLAAKSGVDIRIITPHIPDKWYVHPVTQYNYLELLESGIRIYEFTPGFIHSKLFVADDRVATCGTVNMDYRSFVMHFECGVWMYDDNAVEQIRKDFISTLDKCEEITLSKWKKEPWYRRLKRAVLHIFAPFL